MQLSEINPFMRYAELQPSVMSGECLSCAYDYRIFYIVEGHAELILADRSMSLSPGTLLYFRPGMPYYFNGKVKVIVLNFDMTRRQADQKEPRPPSQSVATFREELVFENDPPTELEEMIVLEGAFEAESKIQECRTHFCYPTPYSDAATSAILKDLLCYIVQSTCEKQKGTSEIVQNIMLYIQQNYDKELSNAQISTQFGYHSFYLNRVFKKQTGMTLHQAVMAEKIRIAKRLLRITALSVSEVSVEAGFSDRSQFCTAFRKYTGYTPTGYRKKKARS